MIPKTKVWTALLLAVQLLVIPTPSSAIMGMLGGGGGGGSDIAEMLAAGLITSLLMEEFTETRSGGSLFQSLRHGLMGGYGITLPPRHIYHPMITPRLPMMPQYALPYVPRSQYVPMNPAFLHQAARQQALASSLNQELQQIRALEAQESYMNAYLSNRRQHEPLSLANLLDDDDVLPAAALLIGSELVESEENLEKSAPPPQIPIAPRVPVPEVYETASTEPESRYILPRIVRHFVQRLMRRAEHH